MKDCMALLVLTAHDGFYMHFKSVLVRYGNKKIEKKLEQLWLDLHQKLYQDPNNPKHISRTGFPKEFYNKFRGEKMSGENIEKIKRDWLKRMYN